MKKENQPVVDDGHALDYEIQNNIFLKKPQGSHLFQNYLHSDFLCVK